MKTLMRVIGFSDDDLKVLILCGHLKKFDDSKYLLLTFRVCNGFGENGRARGTREYKEWKKQVLKRDNYTCKKCGSKINIVVHHIIRFRNCRDNPQLLYDINNGITLCKKCHEIEHGGNYVNG
jgi:ribosomal protein L37AE/L43A